jgi:hypothetical protein
MAVGPSWQQVPEQMTLHRLQVDPVVLVSARPKVQG